MKVSELKKEEIYAVSFRFQGKTKIIRELAKFLRVEDDILNFYWYEDKDNSWLSKKNILSLRKPNKQEIKELCVDEL